MISKNAPPKTPLVVQLVSVIPLIATPWKMHILLFLLASVLISTFAIMSADVNGYKAHLYSE